PFIVISRALRSARTPFGLSFSTNISTSTRCAPTPGGGIFGRGGGFRAGFVAGGGAAGSSGSVSTFARLATSTSACIAMSCRKKLRPIEKYADRLSAVQPTKSPPTFVKRHVGMDDDGPAATVG